MSSEPSEDAPRGQSGQQKRRERTERTNLLLSGTIEGEDIVAPVRIRNLSETGALLEGAALPEVGAHLILRRLDLEIGATVIWAANSRCGIKFEGSISVAGWRSGSWIAPVARGQVRIDEIQASVRAGTLPDRIAEPAAPASAGEPDQQISDLNTLIAEELNVLRNLLEDIGEQLSEEPAVVQNYPRTLQGFDLACQTLGHLAEVVAAQDRRAVVNAIGMQELRQRLQAGRERPDY